MCALSIEDVAARKSSWMSTGTRAVFISGTTVQEKAAYLDRVIPLDGASHFEVENYTIEIPMRYANCFAILTDGRKVRLKDNRQFVGWSGWERKRSYLFRRDGQYIEVRTDPDQYFVKSLPGSIYNIILGAPVIEDQASSLYLAAVRQDARTPSPRLNDEQKFIAPDGDQVVLPGGYLMLKELSATTMHC